MTTDQFFYFFLRLRKGEVRKTIQTLNSRYPQETPEQHARRLIAAKSRLALLGGTLLSLPLLWPSVGQALKLAGVVGATSLLTRMHLYLILEIALAFGKDIDDEARVPEMAAVVTATGLGAATPLPLRSFGLNSSYPIPAGAVSMAGVTQLIGRFAIAFYQRQALDQASGSASAEAVASPEAA